MIIWLGIGIVGSAKKLFGWDCLCRRFTLFCFCLTCFSAGSSFFKNILMSWSIRTVQHNLVSQFFGQCHV
jgi:hypothetical protein